MIPGGLVHVDDRHGVSWPLPAGYRKKWCGWLTHREYDVIEYHMRYDVTNMYTVGKRLGIHDETAERLYYTLFDQGITTGRVEEFSITPMAKILFDMTDQYILEMDLGDEDAEADDEPGNADRASA